MPGVMALFIAFGVPESTAWRVAFLVPATLFLTIGLFIWNFCDDCPQGKFGPSKKRFFFGIKFVSSSVLKNLLFILK